MTIYIGNNDKLLLKFYFPPLFIDVKKYLRNAIVTLSGFFFIIGFSNPASSNSCGAVKPIICIEEPCPITNSVIDLPAEYDPLELGVTVLRLTETSSGANANFKIEGLRDFVPVIGLEWEYAISNDTELRTVSGFHYTANRAPTKAILLYDTNGVIRDTITKDIFYTKVLRWLRGSEQLPTPDWTGSYFTGGSLLTLITKPCTSCDGEWCSCSD